MCECVSVCVCVCVCTRICVHPIFHAEYEAQEDGGDSVVVEHVSLFQVERLLGLLLPGSGRHSLDACGVCGGGEGVLGTGV